MPDVPVKFLIVLALAAGLAWGGWEARGVVSDRDAAQVQLKLDEANAQVEASAEELRRKRSSITEASSAVQDVEQAKQQVITQTVTKEVIKYVQNPAHGKCAMPDDWVCAYNKSLGLPCSGGLPAPGPAPADASAAVSDGHVRAGHSAAANSLDE
jgi:hypothetical protein